MDAHGPTEEIIDRVRRMTRKRTRRRERKSISNRRALRIASSWNVGNGYREEPIVELMVGKEINYLVNQEPIMPKGTSDDRLKWIKYSRKRVQGRAAAATIERESSVKACNLVYLLSVRHQIPQTTRAT